jgi:hypothetical protein
MDGDFEPGKTRLDEWNLQAESINPVRTYIPSMMDNYTPTITESVKAA